MTLKERAANLKRDIPAVFLALKSKKTPLLPKSWRQLPWPMPCRPST